MVSKSGKHETWTAGFSFESSGFYGLYVPQFQQTHKTLRQVSQQRPRPLWLHGCVPSFGFQPPRPTDHPEASDQRSDDEAGMTDQRVTHHHFPMMGRERIENEIPNLLDSWQTRVANWSYCLVMALQIGFLRNYVWRKVLRLSQMEWLKHCKLTAVDTLCATWNWNLPKNIYTLLFLLNPRMSYIQGMPQNEGRSIHCNSIIWAENERNFVSLEKHPKNMYT